MSHVTRSRWFSFAMGILCTLAVVAALGSATGAWAGAPAQDPLPPDQEATGPTSPDTAVTRIIPIQGRLTDAGGSPINGNKSITFTLYTGSGTAVCQDNDTVTVANGLFNSYMDFCYAADVNGQGLWLGIKIHGEAAEMTPRRPIYPVPYAFSLVPGAEIGGIGADDGSLYLKDAAGVTMIGMTASNGLLDLGGVGDDGDLYVRNGADSVTFSADGNTGDVSQALAGDGLVKAAAYVFCSTGTANNLLRSFSHVPGAGVITVINGTLAGRCTIDFGFDVSDRFVVATVGGASNARSVTYVVGSTVNRLNFYRWDTDGTDTGQSGDISVLVY